MISTHQHVNSQLSNHQLVNTLNSSSHQILSYTFSVAAPHLCRWAHIYLSRLTTRPSVSYRIVQLLRAPSLVALLHRLPLHRPLLRPVLPSSPCFQTSTPQNGFHSTSIRSTSWFRASNRSIIRVAALGFLRGFGIACAVAHVLPWHCILLRPPSSPRLWPRGLMACFPGR